jgi:hypothetical protein
MIKRHGLRGGFRECVLMKHAVAPWRKRNSVTTINSEGQSVDQPTEKKPRAVFASEATSERRTGVHVGTSEADVIGS